MSRGLFVACDYKLEESFDQIALLGNVLAGDSWRPWRVILIAAMGEALDDEERAIFKTLTGRPTEPGERVDEFWAVVGRRGGKSRAIAVLIVFIAVFLDHSAVLVVGERPVVLCLAPNQKQAAVVLGYIVSRCTDLRSRNAHSTWVKSL